MNLYIFEPYEWEYCGGAIGIIARTFDEAAETIVEYDRPQAEQMAKELGFSVDSCRQYKSEYFRTNIETFVKDGDNQWLLSHTIPLPDTYIIPRVMFNNWNFA